MFKEGKKNKKVIYLLVIVLVIFSLFYFLEFRPDSPIAVFFLKRPLSQFIVPAVLVILLFLTLFVLTSRSLNGHRHDYFSVLPENRLFFEIISDIIGRARARFGIAAAILAEKTPGLKIDENDLVLRIEKDPIETITILLLNYEKYFHKRIKIPTRAGRRYKDLKKNLRLYGKYFREAERERTRNEKKKEKAKKQEEREAKKLFNSETFLEKINKFK